MKAIIFAAMLIFGFQAQSKTITFTTNNFCLLSGTVNNHSIGKLKGCLGEKHVKRGKSNYPLYLVINSGGGSIYSGMNFIRFAKSIPNVHTYTIFAASMAAGIVEALPGKRYGDTSSIMMFHRAKGSFSGQFEDGEVEESLRFWKRVVRAMEITNANRMKMGVAAYKKRIKDEWWVFGPSNIKSKSLDEMVDARCTIKLMKKKKTITAKTLFGQRDMVISACPLMGRIQ